MIRSVALAAVALVVTNAAPASAQRNEGADRAAIHNLLMDYGRTLDTRDFDGFAKLFGNDGVYVAGNGGEAKGPATGEMMRRIFEANPGGARQPNFHLFFNEVIRFEGRDRARSTSMALWMVPDDSRRPVAAMAARYEDDLVRINGQWRFARRVVKAIANSAATP
jgi:uncharacterized protein (TIGR02246 family)